MHTHVCHAIDQPTIALVSLVAKVSYLFVVELVLIGEHIVEVGWELHAWLVFWVLNIFETWLLSKVLGLEMVWWNLLQHLLIFQWTDKFGWVVVLGFLQNFMLGLVSSGVLISIERVLRWLVICIKTLVAWSTVLCTLLISTQEGARRRLIAQILLLGVLNQLLLLRYFINLLFLGMVISVCWWNALSLSLEWFECWVHLILVAWTHFAEFVIRELLLALFALSWHCLHVIVMVLTLV